MTYHLVGDSTVAACPPAEHPMSGWGAHLAPFVDAPVDNRAVGGSTTEDCLRDVWPELLPEIAAGDTVLIQFGHNDQKRPHLDARGGYADRLRGMVADVRGRGAAPVLCTSVERRWFEGDRVAPTHGAYPNAVRDLARELDVPLIDLNAFTTWLYEDLGPGGSVALLCHFAPGGAPELAGRPRRRHAFPRARREADRGLRRALAAGHRAAGRGSAGA